MTISFWKLSTFRHKITRTVKLKIFLQFEKIYIFFSLSKIATFWCKIIPNHGFWHNRWLTWLASEVQSGQTSITNSGSFSPALQQLTFSQRTVTVMTQLSGFILKILTFRGVRKYLLFGEEICWINPLTTIYQ